MWWRRGRLEVVQKKGNTQRNSDSSPIFLAEFLWVALSAVLKFTLVMCLTQSSLEGRLRGSLELLSVRVLWLEIHWHLKLSKSTLFVAPGKISEKQSAAQSSSCPWHSILPLVQSSDPSIGTCASTRCQRNVGYSLQALCFQCLSVIWPRSTKRDAYDALQRKEKMK